MRVSLAVKLAASSVLLLGPGMLAQQPPAPPSAPDTPAVTAMIDAARKAAAPEFADAHYNLGLMLAHVGGSAQARHHLERYLELDAMSDWAGHARSYLDQIA